MDDRVVPLERNLYGQLSSRTIVGKAIWESSIGTRLGKSFKLGLFYLSTEQKDYFLCVCGWSQNCRQKRKHGTDLEIFHERRWSGRTNLILRHCTRWQCTISIDIVTNYVDTFESRISARPKEKLPTRDSGKPDAEIKSSWSYDMQGQVKEMRGKFIANSQTKRLDRYTKTQHHAWMTINFLKGKWVRWRIV